MKQAWRIVRHPDERTRCNCFIHLFSTGVDTLPGLRMANNKDVGRDHMIAAEQRRDLRIFGGGPRELGEMTILLESKDGFLVRFEIPPSRHQPLQPAEDLSHIGPGDLHESASHILLRCAAAWSGSGLDLPKHRLSNGDARWARAISVSWNLVGRAYLRLLTGGHAQDAASQEGAMIASPQLCKCLACL